MQAPSFDSCKGYIQALANRPFAHQKKVLPSITFSREAGAGAVTIGKLVLEILQKHHLDPVTWTLFDRNLVEKVIEDHALPARLKQFMPEDKMGGVSSVVEEALGLHPNESTMVAHTTETILRLALGGNTIIVGRGGNIITSRLTNVLHVRLVAPFEDRIRRIRLGCDLTEREATLYAQTADRGRKRYVKHYFDADISDPLLYHMVLNTGRLTDGETARLIAKAALDLVV